MVSKLFITNYNLHRFNKSGYTSISSAYKKKLLNNDYRLVHDILTTGPDPIMEIKDKYKVGESPKLHRLNPKYRESAPSTLELPEQSSYETTLPFLDYQFSQNRLSLDPRVYELLFNLYTKIDSEILPENHRILLKNYIGRNLNIIDDIDNGIIHFNRSRANLRYNSTITSLNKIVRPFLLCNGRPLVSVDIKASQVYILASILKNDFFSCKDSGYNIGTIYPKVPGSILFPRFLKGKEAGIEEFRRLPFHQDFYSYVLTRELGRTPTTEERDKLKMKTMQFLFFNNSAARSKNELVYFKRLFPSIDAIITQFLNIIGNSRFSYLLQRSESYLVLENICKEFYKRYPEAPIFTIHDAVLTTADFSTELYEMMFDILHSITGILPGLKIELPNLNVIPSDNSINRVKSKIERRSRKIKQIDKAIEVMDINIKRIDEFLSTKRVGGNSEKQSKSNISNY